ncbi:MAG: type II toxin-antitoxin system RelE/ParE family toxin [Desulfobulbaceae bacterium]|nr:type II toxin-antitoxin system RelE/ParE family toxin [Desulfobulbaceae bacterium]
MATVERIPKKFFEYITGSSGICEIRVEASSNIYRVFCFFYKGHLVILINGFQKKLRKHLKKKLN